MTVPPDGPPLPVCYSLLGCGVCDVPFGSSGGFNFAIAHFDSEMLPAVLPAVALACSDYQ